jgi:hypothetical protein
LGQRLLELGLIAPEQLEGALEMQRRSGGRLGDILLFMRFIEPAVLYREIATQSEMARFGEDADPRGANALPYEMARRLGAVVLGETGDRVLVAVERRLAPEAEAEISQYLNKSVVQALVTSAENLGFWERAYRDADTHESVFGLYEEQADNSAIVTFSSEQRVALLLASGLILIALAVSWQSTLVALNIFFQIVYFLMTVLKFNIVLKGEVNNVQMRFTEEEVASVDERALPVYTVLVPVFREKEVVRKLLTNIATIDYPQHKLDVRILLEEGDEETIGVIRSMALPETSRPSSYPRRRPRPSPRRATMG